MGASWGQGAFIIIILCIIIIIIIITTVIVIVYSFITVTCSTGICSDDSALGSKHW